MASKNIARADGTLRGSSGSDGALTHLAPPAAQLLTEREVAERLNWSLRALQRRRWLRLPPAWIKIGRSVRYQPEAIESFIADGARMPTRGE
jgi:hypothetical protein